MKNDEPKEEKCLFYRNGKTFSDEYSANMIDEEKIGFLVKANQHHHTLLYF